VTAGGLAAGAASLPPAVAAAGAAAAILAIACRGSAAVARDQPLRRHIAVCRRRGERALVLLATTPQRRRAMDADLRISDSAVSEWRRGRSSLVAVVDEHEQSRRCITERLHDRHGGRLEIGWATFPDDGVTLDALLEVARSRVGRVSVESRAQPVGDGR